MRLTELLSTASFRLTSLYLLLFLASVATLGALLFFTVRAALDTEVRNQITNEINLLLFEYREDGLEELLEETEERIEKNQQGERLLYTVQNPDGDVIFDRIGPVTEPYGWRQFDGDASRLLFFTRLDNGYVLGVGKDTESQVAVERALFQALGWTLAAVLLIGTAGGLILSRRALAQVTEITRTARAIGDGRLTQRIVVRHTGDEFDELGRTLNQMFDHIERLVADVRSVSTGFAHDLRTPLARLRTRLEALRVGAATRTQATELESAVAEVDGILDIFSSLLRLAEVNAGALKSGFRKVDLSALAHAVADAYQPLGEDEGIVFESFIEDHIEIAGDPQLLQQMLANLLENALQHAGRQVTVTLRLRGEATGAILEVADNGSGVPADQRERILKPFERLDPAQPGSGLGLALAGAIARLHGADLQLLDNQPGLLCRIKLPM